MEAYVNPVRIRKGRGIAYDYEVVDGHATRFLLEAFRKLDRLGQR